MRPRASRSTALPRRPLLIALALPLLAGGLWLASGSPAHAAGLGTPLEDAELSAVHGAGLESWPAQEASLRELGVALPGPEALAAQRLLADPSQLERQALALHQFAATTGLQASVGSATLATQLVAPVFAMPVLLPVIGLPLLGLLPALPPGKSQKG